MNEDTFIDIDRINYIEEKAKDLFDKQFIVRRIDREGSVVMYSPDPVRLNQIISLISDSGLLYLGLWEHLADLWARIRQMDDDGGDTGITNWILQNTISFRASAFDSQTEYERYVDHLAKSYGIFDKRVLISQDTFGSDHAFDTNVAVDDIMHPRLPEYTEIKRLMMANPWFVFLCTLHLRYHEIANELFTYNPGWLRSDTESSEE